MTKYLLDTCVWRDFYENRYSKKGNPLGQYAANLFMKIIGQKDTVLFSEALIKELNKDYKLEEIYRMLWFFDALGILVQIPITPEEYFTGMKLKEERNIPLIDCLYAIHARNHNATLITQDEHFFRNLSDIIKAKRPQDI